MKFQTMFSNVDKLLVEDVSNYKAPIYEKLPPFAMDSEGNFLNKTNSYVLRKIGEHDFNEEVQSYADEVDMYKLIEKVARTGDDTFLMRKQGGEYLDISTLPNNIHEMSDLLREAKEINLREAMEKLQQSSQPSQPQVDDEVLKSAIAKQMKELGLVPGGKE